MLAQIMQWGLPGWAAVACALVGAGGALSSLLSYRAQLKLKQMDIAAEAAKRYDAEKASTAAADQEDKRRLWDEIKKLQEAIEAIRTEKHDCLGRLNNCTLRRTELERDNATLIAEKTELQRRLAVFTETAARAPTHHLQEERR